MKIKSSIVHRKTCYIWVARLPLFKNLKQIKQEEEIKEDERSSHHHWQPATAASIRAAMN
jgi:hypothetical protein